QPRRGQDHHRSLAAVLQHREATLVAWIQAAGTGGHHLARASKPSSTVICPGNSPKADHALRLKPDHPMGSGHNLIRMDLRAMKENAVTIKIYRSDSLSEQAYLALKAMIVQLELPPGKNFSENELAEKLGISRSPVRAALARLQEDGFIETSGRVGLKTTDIDSRYVRNIYEIRAVLEGLCARKSAKLIPDEEIDK